ncbi:MAG: DUF5717 family protein [Lachnospiraceae bacterium]|nr:DUF5717 family protein [Lachnospiraceae bacterium]
MKRRIEQLLNGIFEYEPGHVTIRPEQLELKGAPGALLHGKFFIESAQGQRIHGYLYPSDIRMLCEPSEFHGISNEIHYQFDCSGLTAESFAAGPLEGTIALCCDCGEFEIPYTVCLEAGQNFQELPFSNLEEFAQLARQDYQSAYRYFLKSSFRVILKENPEHLALYEGLRSADVSYRSLEEFFVASGCKEALELSFASSDGSAIEKEAVEADEDWTRISVPGSGGEQPETLSIDYGELSEPVRETIRMKKNTWGFQAVSVESDALFVRPERTLFSTDDFAGSTFDLNLVLDTNLMHAGNNFARLTLKAGRQTLTVTVAAHKRSLLHKDHQYHIRKIMMKKLENLYVSFRLQKTDTPSWIEHSVSVINSYKRAGGDDPFADLFLIQMYYADDRKHKASRLLEQVEDQRQRLDTPERYCYYLYITTFFYQEASYVDCVEEEVSKQFYRRKESWQLQWILFYLQEKYLNNPGARYEAVMEQFTSGCRSRILYLEAWQALKENPFLLRHLGEFELHLLRFADQEKVMTAEILRQVANLSMHHTAFDDRLFGVLSNGWQLYPSDDLVRAICQILIRGDRKEKKYFEWYARGVDAGLRLNGLYEAYLQTVEGMEVKDFPQIIRMYFSYDASLDYSRRAVFYRSIYENRDAEPQIWTGSRTQMERFLTDQLESGHITEDLAVLYRDFLRESMITPSSAGRLIKLLFTYEIECTRPEMDIRQIVLHSVRIQQDYTVRLKNGRAQIRIYDPDAALFAVDADGVRHEARSVCRFSRLLEDDRMLSWCAKKAPEYPGLVIFLCSQSMKSGLVNDRLLPYFRAGCALPEITEGFRDELRAWILSYYMDHLRDDTLPDFLDWMLSGKAGRRNTIQDFAHVNKTAMITLLAEEGRCAEAFALLDEFGAEEIPLVKLVRIASRMVLELEFEENAMLLSLCRECFARGKYDDKLLRYLLLYFEGPAEEMKQIWAAACEFGLDTMLLEEKILMMILFTRSGSAGSEPVFGAYLKKLGRQKLCTAYVNLKSYEYFVRGLPVAEPVFKYIENEYRRLSGMDRLFEQEPVCRLALLESYARAASLTKTQRVYAAEMLEEFHTKGMRFAFFKRFDEELLRPWQLQGHVFAEYVGNPKSIVRIRYRYLSENGQKMAEAPETARTEELSGITELTQTEELSEAAGAAQPSGAAEPLASSEPEYITELVPNCFEGIFVKEFTLFADEEIECVFEEISPGADARGEVSVTANQSGKRIVSDSRTLRADPDEPDTGMYGLLNRLCCSVSSGDTETAQETLDTWLTLEYLAKEVFTLV